MNESFATVAGLHQMLMLLAVIALLALVARMASRIRALGHDLRALARSTGEALRSWANIACWMHGAPAAR